MMQPLPSSTSRHIADGLDYWNRIRGSRRMPARSDFDPMAIPALLPYVMLVDVLRDPLDFRFRLLGSAHDGIVARDYKGTCFSEVPHLSRGNPVWDEYARVVAERVPLRSSVPYVGPDRDVRSVEHCLMPLSTDGETVDMIFVVAAIARKE